MVSCYNLDDLRGVVMLSEIEKYAHEENVPIMLSDGIDYLCNYIKEHNIKKILEIGSAIGYSAIRMALVDDDICITTIEKDEKRYKIACENIDKFNLNDRINIILDDALNTKIIRYNPVFKMLRV